MTALNELASANGFSLAAGYGFMAHLCSLPDWSYFPMRSGLRADVLNSLLVLAGTVMLFLLTAHLMKWWAWSSWSTVESCHGTDCSNSVAHRVCLLTAPVRPGQTREGNKVGTCSGASTHSSLPVHFWRSATQRFATLALWTAANEWMRTNYLSRCAGMQGFG